MLPDLQTPAISRTMQYKKVTKPLLERKRRARINKCLDELKDLMMGALEADGENVSKLEKADILELTVRHLQRIHQPRDALEDAQKFQAGFGQCATEACKFLLSVPGVDTRVGHNLFKHLGACISSCPLAIQAPNLGKVSSPLPSPSPNSNSNPANVFHPHPQDVAPTTPSPSKSCPKESSSMEEGAQSAKGVLRNVILERRKLAHEMRMMVDEESENEIDVERVEEKGDDMWRPW